MKMHAAKFLKNEKAERLQEMKMNTALNSQKWDWGGAVHGATPRAKIVPGVEQKRSINHLW